MHDPESLAFEIKLPFGGRKHVSPDKTKHVYRPVIAQVWHVDPCRDGTDDSCGRFFRARHGDPAAVDRIAKQIEWDWDRTFTSSVEDHDDEDGPYVPRTRYLGMFHPDTGKALMSSHGIALNIFFSAALEIFKTRKKAMRWLNANLFEILFFAENPTDSLHQDFHLLFGDDAFAKMPAGPQKERRRKERIRSTASCIYAYVMRSTRPWWKNPIFHVHHWRINIPLWQRFNRWAFSRCCKCGGRFYWGESPCTDQWDNDGPRFLRGEHGVYHSRPPCGGCVVESTQQEAKTA